MEIRDVYYIVKDGKQRMVSRYVLAAAFWFLSEQFQSLSAAGKIAVIAGYILVILLIMLWAIFPIRKRKAKTLPTNMAYPVPQPTQEAKNYRHNSEESQNLYKPEKSDVIRSGVYSKLPNNFGNRHIHYHTNNKRQDSKNNSLQGSFPLWWKRTVCSVIYWRRHKRNEA